MRKYAFLVGALVVLLALSGIAVAQDEVTLVLAGHSSTPAEDETLQQQVALFEEQYPNINVEVQLVPEYDTFLQTAFASGDYPNVFYVNQDKVDEFALAGVLASPAEGQITDTDDIYPSLVQTFTFDGTLYCPAKDFSTLALEYNTDLFDQAGVEYPTADWTWEDLATAAQTIFDETGVPGISLNPDIDRWFAFYIQAGGSLYDDEGNFVFASEGENRDAAVAAVDAYASLFESGAAATAQDLGAGWPGEAFGQGKAAMTMEGNWIIQYLIDTFPDLNWGVAELPTGPSGAKGTLVFSECYGVGADNEHLDESWLLVDFLTGPEGATRLAEGGFGPMPTRASSGTSWLDARGPEFEPFVTGAEYAVAPILPPGFQEFRDELSNGLQQVIEGNATADEAIEDAYDVSVELMEE
jgi:multiple sugar transport system substrate-binding protein